MTTGKPTEGGETVSDAPEASSAVVAVESSAKGKAEKPAAPKASPTGTCKTSTDKSASKCPTGPVQVQQKQQQAAEDTEEGKCRTCYDASFISFEPHYCLMQLKH